MLEISIVSVVVFVVVCFVIVVVVVVFVVITAHRGFVLHVHARCWHKSVLAAWLGRQVESKSSLAVQRPA